MCRPAARGRWGAASVGLRRLSYRGLTEVIGAGRPRGRARACAVQLYLRKAHALFAASAVLRTSTLALEEMPSSKDFLRNSTRIAKGRAGREGSAEHARRCGADLRFGQSGENSYHIPLSRHTHHAVQPAPPTPLHSPPTMHASSLSLSHRLLALSSTLRCRSCAWTGVSAAAAPSSPAALGGSHGASAWHSPLAAAAPARGVHSKTYLKRRRGHPRQWPEEAPPPDVPPPQWPVQPVEAMPSGWVAPTGQVPAGLPFSVRWGR